MTYTYNRKGITRKVLSEIVRGLGAKDELKILKSCAYLVRYALRARRATKALRCFTILTLTLFLRCIFQIPPLRQPKDSGNAKMLVACLRVVSLRCQFFSDIFTATAPPCPRKSLGWGGVVAGSCWIVLKTAVKRDAVLCGATCRKIFVFPTYESVACSITTQLLTLT